MQSRSEANSPDRTLLNAIISAVIAVAAVILLILLSFTLFLLLDSSLFSTLPVRPYSIYLVGGIVASAVLLTVSLVFMFRNVKHISLVSKEKNIVIRQENVVGGNKLDENLMNYLDENEREIYTIIVDAGGTVLQRDLSSIKGYSKATMTRILNRLEAKGVIEKMRHGTTNMIVLKRVSK